MFYGKWCQMQLLYSVSRRWLDKNPTFAWVWVCTPICYVHSMKFSTHQPGLFLECQETLQSFFDLAILWKVNQNQVISPSSHVVSSVPCCSLSSMLFPQSHVVPHSMSCLIPMFCLIPMLLPHMLFSHSQVLCLWSPNLHKRVTVYTTRIKHWKWDSQYQLILTACWRCWQAEVLYCPVAI